MTSQVAIQPEAAKAIATPEVKNDFIVEAEKLFARMQEIYNAVERRAYEFFAERGGELGHDAEDWFRAESEFLMKTPAEINDFTTHLLARIEMPDFKDTEVKISVEPRRLLINGKQEHNIAGKKDEIETTEKNTKEVFCRFDLPCEIDTNKVKATFKDGKLEVAMPKRIANPEKSVEVKIE
jgi:HSP20 family protein